MKQLQSLIRVVYIIEFIILCLLAVILYFGVFRWLELGLFMVFFTLGGAIYEYHTYNKITWFVSVKDLIVILSGILFSSVIMSSPNYIREIDFFLGRLLFFIMGLVFYLVWVLSLGSEHAKTQVSFWQKSS